MRFNTVQVHLGRVWKFTERDTEDLDTRHLQYAGTALAELVRGEEKMRCPIDNQNIIVTLGASALELPLEISAPGRLFCLSEVGKPAYLMAMALPQEASAMDNRALNAFVNLANIAAPGHEKFQAQQNVVDLTAHVLDTILRPCVAFFDRRESTISEEATLSVIYHFGAAMLLESTL